ncbi:Guanylate kinase [Buchnera aphidicola (Tetraneura ulmi)]|uniref:guanylate kinase n=1 Tax=Buchnera aphidicola TaxID=9 RepID=UPI0034642663
MNREGILFIISAPSGTGKSSLIKEFLKKKKILNIRVSISHTTRNIRPGEHQGEHYYFVSIKQFNNMIKNNFFLEYAKVFNHYYGTSKKNIYRFLSNGIHVLLDIDWQGAKQIRSVIERTCSIFLLPPSKKELYRRLRNRNQDSDSVIYNRMNLSISEIMHYKEYDYVIINDNFNLAVLELELIIQSERSCIRYQKKKYDFLIKKLLKEKLLLNK